MQICLRPFIKINALGCKLKGFFICDRCIIFPPFPCLEESGVNGPWLVIFLLELDRAFQRLFRKRFVSARKAQVAAVSTPGDAHFAVDLERPLKMPARTFIPPLRIADKANFTVECAAVMRKRLRVQEGFLSRFHIPKIVEQDFAVSVPDEMVSGRKLHCPAQEIQHGTAILPHRPEGEGCKGKPIGVCIRVIPHTEGVFRDQIGPEQTVHAEPQEVRERIDITGCEFDRAVNGEAWSDFELGSAAPVFTPEEGE